MQNHIRGYTPTNTSRNVLIRIYTHICPRLVSLRRAVLRRRRTRSDPHPRLLRLGLQPGVRRSRIHYLYHPYRQYHHQHGQSAVM